MKYLVATAAMLAAAGPAYAQSFSLKPLADLRVRYENVDQEGLPRDANALVFRLRSGLQAADGPWSALVESEATLAAIHHYDDGLHGVTNRPLVADPQTIGLYRAQLQFRSDDFTITAGRQRIALDDERFIGAVNFRINGQTFDAARIEWRPIGKLKADISYAWSVRTIWGIDGHAARPQAISGNSVFANLAYPTPVGTLTGFAYLIDEDEAAVQGYRMSSQTYGARFSGGVPLSKGIKLSYQASYATQADWHRNPNDYRASYYLIDGTLDVRAVRLNAGYEVLGAAHGREAGVALTSFQTPLATTFKFQGWASKFLTTPPNGVRDLYGSAGLGWKKVGPASAVTLQTIYHRFTSDRLGQHYGHEWDAVASAKFGHTIVCVRYADYQADRLFTDTRKIWLQLDWAL